MLADTLPSRDQIDPKYKWNAPSVCESAEAWKREFEEIVPDLAMFDAYRGRPSEGPAVLSGEVGAVDDYLSFLRAGNAMYPLDALKLAGVDMSTPETVEVTFGVLSDMVDRLEALVAK